MIDYDERYKDYPSRIEGILLEGFGAMGDTPTISGGSIIGGKVIGEEDGDIVISGELRVDTADDVCPLMTASRDIFCAIASLLLYIRATFGRRTVPASGTTRQTPLLPLPKRLRLHRRSISALQRLRNQLSSLKIQPIHSASRETQMFLTSRQKNYPKPLRKRLKMTIFLSLQGVMQMISIYDVLKASKGIHVDDTFAELWGRKLSNAYTVATYTGTLPATLQTVAGYLESYKIWGNDGGVGVETESAGYKLPISSNNTTIDIYIGDTALAKDEYVSYSEGKIYRRILFMTYDNKHFIAKDNKDFCLRRESYNG